MGVGTAVGTGVGGASVGAPTVIGETYHCPLSRTVWNAFSSWGSAPRWGSGVHTFFPFDVTQRSSDPVAVTVARFGSLASATVDTISTSLAS